jgi:hypothetical protein
MMSTRRFAATLALVLLPAVAGCNKAAQTESAPDAATTTTSAAAPKNVATPTPSAAQPALVVTESKAKVGGKPLSSVTGPDLTEPLTKAGWKYQSTGGMAMGVVESIAVSAKKDALSARVTISRPSGKPDEAKGMKSVAPSRQAEMLKSRNVPHYLEGEVLISVDVQGNTAEAQKLLDALLTK